MRLGRPRLGRLHSVASRGREGVRAPRSGPLTDALCACALQHGATRPKDVPLTPPYSAPRFPGVSSSILELHRVSGVNLETLHPLPP